MARLASEPAFTMLTELQELTQADHAVGDSHHAHGSILRQNSDRLQRSTPVDRDGVPGSRTTE
jgi:hypothetical protein